ncbi:MAG: prephenate dehydratase [Devosiaceae bacterium]|nr:prephenate dehydratase [Devosiaceae bacterium MH13]
MRIVFQGEPGANSHIACRDHYPDAEAVPCATFEDAFFAVEEGDAELAMIPIENSVAGRVADIHHLLPDARLHITGEHFLPIHHQLLALPGTALEDVRSAQSHVMALGQCRKFMRQHGLRAVVGADTAGSARQIAQLGDREQAAIASALAAEVYGLEILASDIEDEAHNTTRFITLAKEPITVTPDDGPCVTAFIFRVRNVSAALFKALSGFATNSVNMTKLESYQTGGQFFATQFYAEIDGHPEDRPVALALEELEFFSAELRIIGTFKADAYRASILEPEENRALRPSPGV